MKDIPIIFSGAMVNALLSGRKTMTRRLFKRDRDVPPQWDGRYGFSVLTPARHVELRGYIEESGPISRFMAMKYDRGDRLWVRETVACGACALGKPSTWSPSFWRREQGTPSNPNGIWYAADGHAPADPITERGRWVPSIHMPRWCSRLTLEITGTKVERLNDMSEHAIREGVIALGGSFKGCFTIPESKGAMSGTTAVECSRRLWNELHGADAWDQNPEVVAISFKLIRANIDRVPATRAAA